MNLFLDKVYSHVKTNTKTTAKNQRDLILFIGRVYGYMLESITAYEKKHKRKFRVGVIYDPKQGLPGNTKRILDQLDVIETCDPRSETSIHKALKEHKESLFSVVVRGDDGIPMQKRMIPHIPYMPSPTAASLKWATEKISMRERLRDYNTDLTPSFMVVHEVNPKILRQIEEKVSFPLIVKPSGLGASRLVSICYHKEELDTVLKKCFKTIKAVYKETQGRGEPEVLVEAYMEGSMYSIDGYVDAKGRISFCPAVYVKTGKEVGFDDFFGYRQMSPTILKKDNIERLEATAAQSVHALGLRSTSVHIELIRSEHGWKIVELAPRVGGFRHQMHKHTHGIDHTMNDILIRAGEKPIIPKKLKGYAVAMKFFAKKEGKLKRIVGIKKIKELKSLKKLIVNKQAGDSCKFAKHGGSSVFNIIMSNADRSKLLADIRRLEQTIDIQTK